MDCFNCKLIIFKNIWKFEFYINTDNTYTLNYECCAVYFSSLQNFQKKCKCRLDKVRCNFFYRCKGTRHIFKQIELRFYSYTYLLIVHLRVETKLHPWRFIFNFLDQLTRTLRIFLNFRLDRPKRILDYATVQNLMRREQVPRYALYTSCEYRGYIHIASETLITPAEKNSWRNVILREK